MEFIIRKELLMPKKLLIILFVFPVLIFGQTLSFTEHVISVDADGARCVFAADVNRDGRPDVLSASELDNSIVWYENQFPSGFLRHLVDDHALGARKVFAADLDNDGDTDMVAASFDDNIIAWYENDGMQNFFKKIISNTANAARSVFVADVDGDGSPDVLAAYGTTVSWFHNNGDKTFSEHIVSDSLGRAVDVCAGDFNGDGYTDIEAADFSDNYVLRFINDGSQNFTAVDYNLIYGPYSVFPIEMNGDGNMDVIATSNGSWDRVYWLPSGKGASGDEVTSSTLDGPRSAVGADLDGDGDIDVVSASETDDQIAWYENDGSQNFTADTISLTANGAQSVYTADLNGDGRPDIISASYNDDKIAWYENGGTSALETPGTVPAQIRLEQNYPNPFNPSTTLRYELSKAAHVLLTIYNVAGEKVAVLVQERQAAGTHRVQWNAKSLPSGIYFAELKVTGQQNRLCKMTLLK